MDNDVADVADFPTRNANPAKECDLRQLEALIKLALICSEIGKN